MEFIAISQTIDFR